jgi:multicomponent Na+:H+ antiporter subunit B
MAQGVGAVRRALRFNPLGYAGFGVLLAAASGLVAAFYGTTFLTAHWLPYYLFGVPGVFDVGVYFVVFGTLTAIALALEDDGEGADG